VSPLLLKPGDSSVESLHNWSSVVSKQVEGASTDSSTLMPFAAISLKGRLSLVVSSQGSWSLCLSVGMGSSVVLLDKLNMVGMCFLSGVGGPDWAELHMSVDSGLIDLGFLENVVPGLDHVCVLGMSFNNSSMLGGHFSGSLVGFSSIDESGSGALVGDHLGLPSFILNWSGGGSHLFVSILGFCSICELGNSILYLLALKSHRASRTCGV